MTIQRINQLPQATSLVAGDRVLVFQDNITKQIDASLVASAVVLKNVGGVSLLGAGDVSAPTFSTLTVTGALSAGSVTSSSFYSQYGNVLAYNIQCDVSGIIGSLYFNGGWKGLYTSTGSIWGLVNSNNSTGLVSFMVAPATTVGGTVSPITAWNVLPSGAVTIPGQVNIGAYAINATKFQVDNTVSRLQIGYNGTGDSYLDGASWNFRTYTGGALLSIASSGAVTIPGSLALTGASSTLGYGTGSGGTVTQITNKSTGVTLNKCSGQITMNNAALGTGGEASFVLSNSLLAITDCVVVNVAYSASYIGTNYDVRVTQIGPGGTYIYLKNVSAGSLSDAVVINFSIIKGANA